MERRKAVLCLLVGLEMRAKLRVTNVRMRSRCWIRVLATCCKYLIMPPQSVANPRVNPWYVPIHASQLINLVDIELKAHLDDPLHLV